MKPIPYANLHKLTEAQRIPLIVEQLKTGQTIGVLVDDTPGKAERYLEKIRVHLPAVIIEFKGPLKPGVTLLKLKIQNQSAN